MRTKEEHVKKERWQHGEGRFSLEYRQEATLVDKTDWTIGVTVLDKVLGVGDCNF